MIWPILGGVAVLLLFFAFLVVSGVQTRTRCPTCLRVVIATQDFWTGRVRWPARCRCEAPVDVEAWREEWGRVRADAVVR